MRRNLARKTVINVGILGATPAEARQPMAGPDD